VASITARFEARRELETELGEIRGRAADVEVLQLYTYTDCVADTYLAITEVLDRLVGT